MPQSGHASLAPVLAIIAIALIVLLHDISIGGFRYGDAAVHAMDGVLIHDWVAAGPSAWRDPMGFAEQQYAHYPSLGIGQHYPPGYAIVEAGFFAVLGISVIAARLCVVFFGVMAALGTYVFVRFWCGRLAGLLSACFLITLPATTTWGRQNMLEVPTLCALVWAGVVLNHYLSRPSWVRLIGVLLAACAAVLFKQPAIFFLGAVSLILIVLACGRHVPRAHAAVMAVFAPVILLVVLKSLDGNGAAIMTSYEDSTAGIGWHAWLFYVRGFAQQVGWPCLVAAPIGLLICLRRRPTFALVAICWLLVCYVMLCVPSYKNHRFMYVGLLPFAMLSGVLGAWAISFSRRAGHRLVATIAVLLLCMIGGLRAEVEKRPDYGPIVEASRARIEGRVVLFSGLRDGDFVFAVRERLPWRRAAVIRGSKLLYTCAAMPKFGFASNVTDPQEVHDLLHALGIEQVFVERDNKLGLAEDSILRDLLQAESDYVRVATQAFQQAWIPPAYRVTIDAYQSREPMQRREKQLAIYIPRAGRTITLDLDTVGK